MKEKKESKTDKRGIEIVDMLADEGMTYREAQLILQSAEWELGERKCKETAGKAVSKNKAR